MRGRNTVVAVIIRAMTSVRCAPREDEVGQKANIVMKMMRSVPHGSENGSGRKARMKCGSYAARLRGG